jgi:CheY-like chemotaxis protein
LDPENLESKRKKKTILVVDDNEAIRLLFQRSFKDDDVYTCESAEEAFRVLEDVKFEVMIIDIKLPGMDGCSFCNNIREVYPDAFILAMTGYANKFEFVSCQSAGFDAYFVKPLSLKMIHQVIEEHFSKS